MPAKCGSSPREKVGIVRSVREFGARQAHVERPLPAPLPAAGWQLGLGVERPPSLAGHAIEIGMMVASVVPAINRRMIHGAASHASSQIVMRPSPGIGLALCAASQLARTMPPVQASRCLTIYWPSRSYAVEGGAHFLARHCRQVER